MFRSLKVAMPLIVVAVNVPLRVPGPLPRLRVRVDVLSSVCTVLDESSSDRRIGGNLPAGIGLFSKAGYPIWKTGPVEAEVSEPSKASSVTVNLPSATKVRLENVAMPLMAATTVVLFPENVTSGAMGIWPAHTANAGATYFPAGTPDPNDVFDGKVDLAASALRELEEETGIAADAVACDPGWTVVYAPPRIACLKLMRLAEPADAVKARIEAFLAADPEAELSGMRIVRGPADIDRAHAPGFIVDFLDDAFAHKSAG